MNMLAPGAPVEYPGLDRFDFAGHTGTGASPRPWSVQLPSYGVWLVHAFAWYQNANFSIERTFIVTWYRFDAATTQTKNLASASAITPATPATDAASGTGNEWTGLSATAPTTTGLVGFSGTFSGADKNPKLVIKAIRLVEAVDFTR